MPDEVQAAVREYATEKIQWVMEEFDRHAREDRENQVEEDVQAHFADIFPEMQREINDALYVIKKEIHAPEDFRPRCTSGRPRVV